MGIAGVKKTRIFSELRVISAEFESGGRDKVGSRIDEEFTDEGAVYLSALRFAFGLSPYHVLFRVGFLPRLGSHWVHRDTRLCSHLPRPSEELYLNLSFTFETERGKRKHMGLLCSC